MALGEADGAALAADVTRAVDANLDMLRIHGHVTRPEVYAAADEAGLLLWQDVPLQWGYARGARKPAAAQARALVDLLGHHPSVAVWCGHNEPYPGPPAEAERDAGKVAQPGGAAAAELEQGRARPVGGPGVALRPHPAGGDPLRRPPGAAAGRHRQPPVLRLVHGGHGRHGRRAASLAPAGPVRVGVRRPGGAGDRPAFMEPQRWPDLDWAHLEERHNLQPQHFARFVPPDEFATFDDWRAATQAYQAALIQLQIEDLRRLRYRPTGGFLQFCFADGHPGVTWSVLDHDRRPKAGHGALTAACRSVLPMVDPRTGHVHVANELRTPFPGAEIEVRIGGDDLALRRRPGRRLPGLRREGAATPGLRGGHRRTPPPGPRLRRELLRRRAAPGGLAANLTPISGPRCASCAHMGPRNWIVSGGRPGGGSGTSPGRSRRS